MKKLSYITRSNDGHWVGDGFPVRTIFSYHEQAEALSPFLLMDYAGPKNFEPTSRRRGVGAHPHRGFETVTIVYPGDVQWMTAGAGVLHEEYHSPHYARSGGPFEMIQLWVNLPATDKLTAPGYQGITDRDIPRIALPDKAGSLRLIAGQYDQASGAARTFSPMNVWDLSLNAGASTAFDLPAGHTTALFVLHGTLRVENQTVSSAELAVMERAGSKLAFEAVENSVVLLLSGEPLNEPVVGHGPFVMNSREEIDRAIDDFNEGRFGHMPSSA